MSDRKKGEVLRILLADDDTTDRELFIEALRKTSIEFEITEASNGWEVMDHLAAAHRLPHIIFLDVNMPRKDGRETLREIKSSKRFKSVPVAMMSNSDPHFEVSLAYEDGVNFFLLKPGDFRGLVDMLSNLLTVFNKYMSFARQV